MFDVLCSEEGHLHLSMRSAAVLLNVAECAPCSTPACLDWAKTCTKLQTFPQTPRRDLRLAECAYCPCKSCCLLISKTTRRLNHTSTYVALCISIATGAPRLPLYPLVYCSFPHVLATTGGMAAGDGSVVR